MKQIEKGKPSGAYNAKASMEIQNSQEAFYTRSAGTSFIMR